MALSSQHFFMKLVFAAPASALPSLPTALTEQDCAQAEPIAKEVITAASTRRFILSSRFTHSPRCKWKHMPGLCSSPTGASATYAARQAPPEKPHLRSDLLCGRGLGGSGGFFIVLKGDDWIKAERPDDQTFKTPDLTASTSDLGHCKTCGLYLGRL